MVMGGLVGLSLAAGVEAAAPPGTPLLQETWQVYLRTSVRHNGRVVDAKGGGHTTSEGQAYGLLRAVWANDPDSFDRIYTWTFRRLQRNTATRAPAWKYGRAWLRPRILDEASATDADHTPLRGARQGRRRRVRAPAAASLSRPSSRGLRPSAWSP